MTKPLPVLVDMDGVLADFDEFVFNRFAEWLEIDSLEDQHQRYITDHVTGVNAAEEKQRRAKIRRAIDTSGFFRSLPVIDGAQEGIEKLQSSGLDVWVCSKPLISNPTCASEKYSWLGQHFPDLQDKLILAPDKSLVRGSVLIDDAPKMRWIKQGAPTWTPFIYAYKHNEALQTQFPSLTWDTLDDGPLDLIQSVVAGDSHWLGVHNVEGVMG